MKYIFISGGVISGLGKGIITASISLLLKNVGIKVSPVKIDMYLNVDAGTIRPLEHGETFVTKDGLETDQDIGNYERFLGQDLDRVNYITTGQIYQEVLRKERAMEYDGEDVEAIPHLTDEIIRRIKLAASSSNADISPVGSGSTGCNPRASPRVWATAESRSFEILVAVAASGDSLSVRFFIRMLLRQEMPANCCPKPSCKSCAMRRCSRSLMRRTSSSNRFRSVISVTMPTSA